MPASLALRMPHGDLATRSADTRPTTWREDDLSIEAIAATEHPTRMRILTYDREYGGNRYQDFDEVLDVAGLSDDEIRGFVGSPILDSHSAWSTMTVVGVIDEARREGTQLIVRFRLSKTEETIVSKVRDGILQKVSIGYRRKDGAVITEREGNVPLRRQPFVPLELSLVGMGADPNAVTRSATNLTALTPSAPVNQPQEPAMNVDAIRSAVTGLAAAVAALQTATTETPAAPAAGARGADPVDQAAQATIEGQRSDVVHVPAPGNPAGPASSQPPSASFGARSAAEIEAIGHIRKIAVDGGRGAQFDAMEKAGEPLAGLRSIAMGCLVTTSPETNGTTSGADGQRSDEAMITFDEAVRGQRGVGGDVQALAQALAGFVSR